MPTPSSYRFRDSAGNMQEAPFGPDAIGNGNTGVPSTGDLDTDGAIVPTWMRHTYTYDASQNVSTDTVWGEGDDVWVRTYEWTAGALASDSGWVKQ